MYTVYVLLSKKLGKKYIGFSENPHDRVNEHNRGRSKFTSRGIPWELKYVEYYETRTSAITRERFLKTGAGRIFLNRVFDRIEGYPEKEIPETCVKYDIL